MKWAEHFVLTDLAYDSVVDLEPLYAAFAIALALLALVLALALSSTFAFGLALALALAFAFGVPFPGNQHLNGNSPKWRMGTDM